MKIGMTIIVTAASLWTVLTIMDFLILDRTDKGFFKRSGVRLYIDYETGVHYVSSPRGGITPRLKEDGSVFTENEYEKNNN